VGSVGCGAQRSNHDVRWWDTGSTPNQKTVGGGRKTGIQLRLPPNAFLSSRSAGKDVFW